MDERPIKVDLSDGPCPHCKVWQDRRKSNIHTCDDCGRDMPLYANMGGHGYESATVHHSHLSIEAGKALWLPVMRELCRECYLTDYAKQFPAAALPAI